MNTLTITIIKAHPSMWYNANIKAQFKVIDTPYNYYKYKGKKIIFKSDALVNK